MLSEDEGSPLIGNHLLKVHPAIYIQRLQQCCIFWIGTGVRGMFTANSVFREKTKMVRRGTSYTTSDLSRKSGDIIADALRHPVTITQRNKPRLVLLNIDDYERLIRQSDARTVETIDTMSDQLFAQFEAAVDAYADVTTPSDE